MTPGQRKQVKTDERERIIDELSSIIPPPWGPSEFWRGWSDAVQAIEVNFDLDRVWQKPADWGVAEREVALAEAERRGAEKGWDECHRASLGGFDASNPYRADQIAQGQP